MVVYTWTPLVFTKKGFPRDEQGVPFLPGNVLKEGIESAFVYYYIKKDKEIESKVKAYLLKKRLDPETVIDDVKRIIEEKYPFVKEVVISERLSLNGEVKEMEVEVFDLKKWEEVESFKVEAFVGSVEGDFQIPEKLKPAAHSFCEALARMEMSMLQDHPLVEKFYQPLLNDMKRWEIPLRLGMWTEVKYRGYLLFFWRIKEVREKLMGTLKMDIRPKRVLFFPKNRQTAGWCEIKP